MTTRFRALLAAACVALAACSSGQAGGKPASGGTNSGGATAAADARHPVSGLPVVPLKIGTRTFRVEVARTEEQQQRGLMFRTEMGADEGMIFLRQPPDYAAFWMRNTVIPLDIIFIGKDRRILNIQHGVPYDETPLPAAGITLAVLELNGGRAEALGIKPGDTVEW